MLNLLRSGDLNFASSVAYILSALSVIFLTMPVHEYAHALTAYRMGDRTAYYQGRKTINPLAHIDYLGALLIIVFGFGWAKPVPVNMRNFRNPKAGMAVTALAGPVSNLIMAFISMFLYNLVGAIYYSTGFGILVYVGIFFRFVAQINISLAAFNLIPIPPLDGSRILTAILPDRIYYKLMQYERYFFFIIIILLYFKVLMVPLDYLIYNIYNAFQYVTGLPFGL